MSDDVALDTSASIPLLQRRHPAHHDVRAHLRGRRPVLTSHSLIETYSVLTRLPNDARLAPPDAVKLLDANFGPPALLAPEAAASLPALLAPLGVAGGAIYDALVALATKHAGLHLVTRDARATATYTALGCPVELVARPLPS